MAAAKLPIELCDNIIEQIESHEDILPLLQVSSAFRAKAQRRLYRRVFGNRTHHRTTVTKIVSRWLDSIGEIGRFVYSLDLQNARESVTTLAERLPAAYGHMINLKELCLPVVDGAALIPSTTSPFQLVLFSFTLRGVHSSVRVFEDKFIPFLNSQPAITELDMCYDYTEPISPDILPNLSILSAKRLTAFQLLPSRSVTCLYLYISELPEPIRGLQGVTTLRSISLDEPQSLRLYECCFPTLEFLELTTRNADCLHPWIQHMQRLRILCFLADEYETESAINLSLQDAGKLFEVAPSLELVHVVEGWESQGHPSYAWARGESESTEITWRRSTWKQI